ncbi:MAG: response regulator [Pseudomonadota bacterium]
MESVKMTVLIIDPQRDHGHLYQAMLEHSGYEVETCACFKEGMEKAAQAIFDCVIMVAGRWKDECSRLYCAVREASPMTKIIYLIHRRDDIFALPRDEMTFASVVGF